MTIYNNHSLAAPFKRVGSLALVVSALTACVADNGDNSSSAANSSSTPAISSSSIAVSSSSEQSSSIAPSSSSQAPASSSSAPVSSSSQASSVSYQVPANNFAVNGDVEDGLTNWGSRASETVEATNAEAYEGSYSLFVTDRTAFWNGATFNVGRLTAGNEYEVAAWVKLAAGEPDAIVKITGKRVDDANDDDHSEYSNVDEQVVTSDSWTLLRGTYTPTGETPFQYFIVEANAEGDELSSYYVDQFVVAGEVEDEPDPEPIPVGSGLKDLTSIPVGVAVSIADWNAEVLQRSFLDGPDTARRQQLVANEFSQISLENTMKMNYWDGSNYSNSYANRIMQWAAANNKEVHGHTLVWHPCYQLPSWANTQSGTQYMQSLGAHVRGVASQFAGAPGDAGKIVSWDVVNEVLQDSGDDGSYSDCRYESGGQVVGGVNYRRSAHFEGAGGPDYIHHAFTEANKVTDADLYYNDFNIENNDTKTDSLIAMLQDMHSKGTPIDGVGFQMHVGPDWPSVGTISAAWKRVLDLGYGLKIKLTELDVRINFPYGKPDSWQPYTSCSNSEAMTIQQNRYRSIIQAYYDTVPAEYRGGITVWGITDTDSWFADFTYNGQTYIGCPLLFDGNFDPKPAYNAVQQVLNSEG